MQILIQWDWDGSPRRSCVAGPQSTHCIWLYNLVYVTLVKRVDKNLRQATISTSFNNFYGFMTLIWGMVVTKLLIWGKTQLLTHEGLREAAVIKEHTPSMSQGIVLSTPHRLTDLTLKTTLSDRDYCCPCFTEGKPKSRRHYSNCT